MTHLASSLGLVLATSILAIAGEAGLPPDLEAMVETERAFARAGVEQGFAPAFNEFFADDGIVFNPHPTRFREEYRKNPPPPVQRQFALIWWPIYGDVAESGELGYNTGPSLVSDLTLQKRPARHGFFFSVWKKQADGAWRVAVDMGADVPAVQNSAQRISPYIRAPQPKTGKFTRKDAAAARAELMSLEGEFLKAATHQGYRDGYLGYLADTARIHRRGFHPITGKAPAGEFLAGLKVTLAAWEAMDGGVAASGELGYTYGRYELKPAETSTARVEKGYYTRVWKRDSAGAWKIVADVASPLPPEEKP